MKTNNQAKELNKDLKEISPQIYSLLSEFGKKAFFPKAGILSQAADAKGKDINATIGIALDDSCKPLTLNSITKNSKLKKENTVLYSSSYGQDELRKKWMERIKRKNPSLEHDLSSPVITNGITHALSTVAKLFVNKGEKIIIPDKIWGNYKLVFEHAEFDTYETFSENGFNVKGLKEKLKENTGKQIIILNFPNNPTGYSITEKEAEIIADTIKESAQRDNKILVMCDDAYFGLFYDENVYKESIFSKLANLHENVLAVKCDGVTKEMYSWGLRVGFVTYGYDGINDKIKTVLEDKTAGPIRGNISNVCTHSQILALQALENKNLEKQELDNFDILKERYEKVKEILDNKKYKEHFEALPFNSGYFMCVELKKDKGENVRQKLLKEYSTGVIAIDNILRIAFSSVPKKELEALFENIYKACKNN